MTAAMSRYGASVIYISCVSFGGSCVRGHYQESKGLKGLIKATDKRKIGK